MKVTILGAAGFLGRKIARRLAADGTLGGAPVTGLTLLDIIAPAAPEAPFPVATLAGDLTDLPAAAIPPDTGIVFDLAAVVSAAAEADYDLGLRVNLLGTIAVIQACRRLTRPPRVVFTSSVASFGGSQDSVLADDARQVPTNSYGTQKAAAELLLIDASRRGFLDAVNLRLPTVSIRPGRPNKAASSFLSAILREPLLGLPTTLPVPAEFAAWICSPRRAVDWLLHAASLDTAALGLDRGINPPGVRARVDEMLAALDSVSPGASALVHAEPDPAIAAIVSGWPAAFDASRARSLGFSPHESLRELVETFIADDLAETRADRQAA